MMSSRNDVQIIRGMDAIVNKDNIRSNLNISDLKELEDRMVSGGLIQQKIKDPTDKFQDELQDAANKLGINFGDPKPKKAFSPRKFTQLPAVTMDTRYTPSRDTSYAQPAYRTPQRDLSYVAPSYQSTYQEPSVSAVIEEDSDDEDAGAYSGVSQSPARDYSSGGGGGSPYNRFASDSDRPRYGGDLHSRTQEEERRAHIDSVMGDSGGNNGFSFDKEKREDEKCNMLAEIDSLLTTLADEDTNLDRIPKVDRESEYAEVESVLKMLRYKNDNTRYCSFAEEFLLFGAYGLEELFDGKNLWFSRYKPDLTGWHNHVNIKLRRMKHDTSSLVSGVMQDYNIGPGARILLELVPNMILYSKMKSSQHQEPDLFIEDGEETTQAANRIRDL